MRHEPNGLKEIIESHLISAYDITPNEMTFIPVGEESTSYKVETGVNAYIVKFNQDTSSQEQTEKTHVLLQELAENSFIIPPVQTFQGTTIHEVENGYISVFPFVKGPLVVEENPDFHDELVEKLVEICAILQNKTQTIQTQLPAEDFNENYMLAFEEVLKQAKIQTEKRFSQVALQHERKIKELIEGLVKLNEHYKKIKPSLVITHGDITGLNIIQVPGDIKLLDWDGCMLAPKERDLMFLNDSPFFNKEEYLKSINETKIDAQLISYYKLRWALNSIVVNLHKLATQSFSEVDEKVELADIVEYLSYY